MPFACIYVPNFAVAAALRVEPDLNSCAVAILEGKPPLETIIAINKHAGELGIAPGMSKAQAELCTELAMRSRSPLQESSAHAALLDCAQSFSPCVEASASDTVVLDLAGMESLLGPLPKIARSIFDRASTARAQSKCCHRLKSRRCPAGCPRIFWNDRDSPGERGRAIGAAAAASFIR